MIRDCRFWSGALVLVIGILLANRAFAHTRSQSFSSWKVRNGTVWMIFTVQSLEAGRLLRVEDNVPSLDALLVDHLTSRITVAAGGEECRTVTGPLSMRARKGHLRVAWRFECLPDAMIEITNNAFFEQMASHVHYARVRAGERPLVEYLFTELKRRLVIEIAGRPQLKSRGASFGTYVLMGIQHILVGVDHLAFLVALLLLCRRVRYVIFMVTGFTLGHSITLSLAVVGIMEPNPLVIEALIGFTIALVAVENISVTTDSSLGVAVIAGLVLLCLGLLRLVGEVGPPAVTLFGLALFTVCYLLISDTRETATRLRPTLTVLFGLIHGFGFASVLMELNLPTNRLVSALFGFNLGVEIGQLGIVTGLAIMGRMLAQRYAFSGSLQMGGHTVSAVLCALGLYWFIQRGYAL